MKACRGLSAVGVITSNELLSSTRTLSSKASTKALKALTSAFRAMTSLSLMQAGDTSRFAGAPRLRGPKPFEAKDESSRLDPRQAKAEAQCTIPGKERADEAQSPRPKLPRNRKMTEDPSRGQEAQGAPDLPPLGGQKRESPQDHPTTPLRLRAVLASKKTAVRDKTCIRHEKAKFCTGLHGHVNQV